MRETGRYTGSAGPGRGMRAYPSGLERAGPVRVHFTFHVRRARGTIWRGMTRQEAGHGRDDAAVVARDASVLVHGVGGAGASRQPARLSRERAAAALRARTP